MALDNCGNHKTYILNDGIFVDISLQSSYTQSGLNNKAIALLNPFRYRGYYYDVETGLYYLNSRYYDPEIGRFINADDIFVLSEGKDFFNGLNLYAYCGDNPVNNTDESGNAWWHWLLFGIGAALVVAAVAILTVASVGAFTGLAGAIIVGAAKGALVGAVVGSTIGIAGGAIYSAVTGADMGQSILSGFLLGFGIGAVVGAVIGGFSGYLAYTPTKITGFTKHGLNQIISRNGHGVSNRTILNTIKNSTAITRQGIFKQSFKFIGKEGVVILNKFGKLITAWARKSIGWRF